MRAKWLIKAWVLVFGGWVCQADSDWIDNYNVVWESPSADQSGQMPLGNGDIAAGVYAIEDDALFMLLSKNDALTYNGDIFKTGRVKIALDPNPFAKGKPFRQTLDLKTGSIRIEADGTTLQLWADANRPVYHVQIESPVEVLVLVAADPWTRFDSCRHNRTSEPLEMPTQDVVLSQNGYVLTYYAVGDRSVYPTELKYYEIEHMASEYSDPYRFNTFGNLIESSELELKDGALYGSGKTFDIRIHAKCSQEPDPEKWIGDFEKQAANPTDVAADWKAHCQWWSGFWNRGWIQVNDSGIAPDARGKLDHEVYKAKRNVKDNGAMVAQSYNVFRYLMACQSRGRIQTKFNGGILSQPLRYTATEYKQYKKKLAGDWRIEGEKYISSEDQRLWGRRFTHQNQRLLYWPLLMSGDADLMQPFFDFYWNLLPMRRAVCKAWFGHDGAYFRENMELTGGERDCAPSADRNNRLQEKPIKTPQGGNVKGSYHHSYYFTAGLESAAMMIDYVKYTQDDVFRDDVLVPFAREILTFYDKHYPRDGSGKLRMDPSQALETWWVAINPANDIAGLLYNLDGLLAIRAGTDEDRETWRRFRQEIPEVHLQEIEGRMAIVPALEWSVKKNTEIPELYPLFPFTRFSAALGTKDIAEWTMENRIEKNARDYKCWTQDQIGWAYAGNAAEAQDGLIRRFLHTSPRCRFPLYGSQNPDSCPDFDHFGSGSIALQRMLVQEAAGEIHLLPAWPKTWDVDFKLHLSGNAVITGLVKDGKLQQWAIEPASRSKNVVVHEPQ
ncbi:DUF5703 domain-containing protein [Pontiella sulfatireligans]|uniref:DUF5703 domain-containing protein n=1 Tax=Pontiella sulfatireligans TaxID=2750658 RepID=A0A6C2UF92_9BACT|nr:DUF5703 domain-containing protein [Pontiella sulfatireligans]VGO18815.1 hypothetical protein SCARR_00868 [Pontiella sulfatireligans]